MKVPFSNRTCLISGPSGSDLMKHTHSGELHGVFSHGGTLLRKLRPKDFEQSTVTGRGVLTLHLVVTVSVIVSLLGVSLLVHLHRKPSTLSRLSNTVDPAHLGASVACRKCL